MAAKSIISIVINNLLSAGLILTIGFLIYFFGFDLPKAESKSIIIIVPLIILPICLLLLVGKTIFYLIKKIKIPFTIYILYGLVVLLFIFVFGKHLDSIFYAIAVGISATMLILNLFEVFNQNRKPMIEKY
ncbi:MAG: hypothetical protein HUJ25_00065 [Crocinitomicaceae bacterium]|nr:hypothetical protein [Crocinitomicaceae bacterium]